MKKRWDTHICIADSLFCTTETNNIVKQLHSNKDVKKSKHVLKNKISHDKCQKKRKKTLPLSHTTLSPAPRTLPVTW